MLNQTTIIIGANSEIAKALVATLVKDNCAEVIVVSRNVQHYQTSLKGVKCVQVDAYNELNIIDAVTQINLFRKAVPITRVYICHGVLHDVDFSPEKRLEDFNASAFNAVLSVNALTPLLWLKHLLPSLVSKVTCQTVFLSARVGSITDNHLGGWYSYRASKTALNMLLKTAAVECKRRAKNVKLISFHPGTTDSPLSKPFQRNVSKDKLFTSQFVADCLLNVCDQVAVDGELSYLDWQGKSIPW